MTLKECIKALCRASKRRQNIEKQLSSEWQPIETAPRDKTYIIGWQKSNNSIRRCWWADTSKIYHPIFGQCKTKEWWMNDQGDIYDPDYWMPFNPPGE